MTLLSELCENSDRLFNILRQYWCILFDTAHIKRTGHRVTIFSEFTESHLLAASVEQQSIQKTITNIFIYLVLETKVITIDLMLKLLMDYLASRVCQAGYQTAQLVLQVLLEAYFYNQHMVRLNVSNVINDLCEEEEEEGDEEEDEDEEEDNIACGSGAINDHSYVTITTNSSPSLTSGYSQTNSYHRSNYINHNYNTSYHQQNHTHHIHSQQNSYQYTNYNQPQALHVNNISTADSYSIEKFYGIPIHTEAMKILIRIYLGKMKAYSQLNSFSTAKQSSQNTNHHQSSITSKRATYLKFLRQNMVSVVHQHDCYARNSSGCNNENNRRDSSISVNTNAQQRRSYQFVRNLNMPLDKRPILYLKSRPKYLNSMEPFESSLFLYSKPKDGLSDWTSIEQYELIGDWNDIQLTVLKFQVI